MTDLALVKRPINTLESELARLNGLEKNTHKIYETELVICRTVAGYYVGRFCLNWVLNEWIALPHGNVGSEYHSTVESAEVELNDILSGIVGELYVKEHI